MDQEFFCERCESSIGPFTVTDTASRQYGNGKMLCKRCYYEVLQRGPFAPSPGTFKKNYENVLGLTKE